MMKKPLVLCYLNIGKTDQTMDDQADLSLHCYSGDLFCYAVAHLSIQVCLKPVII